MWAELHPEEQQPRQSFVVTTESCEHLDEVDLSKRFLARVLMLKSCPYFFQGRLRQCWAVALRDRHRARQAHDTVAEESAWKLFRTIPLMLLHRPRGSGSVGRDELAKGADDFARDIGLHFFAIPAAGGSRCAAEQPTRARPRSKPAGDKPR